MVALLHFAALVGAVVAQSTVETQTVPLGGGQTGTNTVTVPVSSSSAFKVETQTIPLGGGQTGTNTVTVPLSAVMTTQVVTALTTFCPSATVLSVNNKNYTITSATTLTITDCPCTIIGTMDSQATATTSMPVAYTGAAEVVKPAVAMLALGAMALF
jgi:hypothetical protein